MKTQQEAYSSASGIYIIASGPHIRLLSVSQIRSLAFETLMGGTKGSFSTYLDGARAGTRCTPQHDDLFI